MKLDDDVDLRRIAEDTELFTGAELEGLCREAGIVALRESIKAAVVCNRHFQKVRESLKPALTKTEVDSYASFMKNPSSAPRAQIELSSSNEGNGKTSFLSPVLPVKVCVLSFVLAIAARYFLRTEQTRRELATT